MGVDLVLLLLDTLSRIIVQEAVDCFKSNDADSGRPLPSCRGVQLEQTACAGCN
ncbi:hypothetical protein DPMN_001790 [Dreissena polymorpha]|uniref:Uncharacterized protein n=1 Tax=Dreissena polymorpha TaxID=45954 RepID=A0A9D4MIF8_DREPO|nr:hypothetical protein DPMN_001790 [Dreissena polymorpha]